MTIPPKCEVMIPITISSTTLKNEPDMDLCFEPVAISHAVQNTWGSASAGLHTNRAESTVFANLGNHPITLRRGTRVAFASRMGMTVEITRTRIRHVVGGTPPAEFFSCVPKQTYRPTAPRVNKRNEHCSELFLKWDGNNDAEMMAAAELPDPNDRPPPEGPEPTTVEFDVSSDFGADSRPPSVILEVLTRNREAFTFDGKPGLVSGVKITLDTEDDKLLPERLRQMSPAKKAITDDTMNQLLDWDVIEESDSRLSFPVVIVKQNGKYRFCVDYRNLNRFTKHTIYPMQRSDEMFDALAGKSVFSNLDAARGYHQIEVDEKDRWKTAFLTHRGLYHYKRMPFGLKTAPAVFQKFMDNMLGRLRWTCALCYIDDVIIFSNSIEEHAQHVDAVLTAARATGLKFSPSKCHFAYSSLTLLGRKISPEGLEILEDKAAAVIELATPTNIRELWHVLGLFGYYRAFIHRYSIIAAPLTDITKGIRVRRSENGWWDAECSASLKAPLQWTTECEQAFAEL
jgi:hypothetical protein